MDPTADPNELMQSNTRNLMSAISSLPQLTERKKTIDKHTNIATALLRQIQARALKQYWDREEDCLHGKPDLAAIEVLLQVRTLLLVPIQRLLDVAFCRRKKKLVHAVATVVYTSLLC